MPNTALTVAALVFVGFNLRTILLEVPPVLPQIQRDLGLSYTATGFLNALPPLVMGLGAYPAALAIGRLGAARAVTIALAAMAVTALLRAFAGTAPLLFAATVLMSAAIALCQTTAPLVVREWFPRRIGQTTAAYSTGLMVGEIAAAWLTVPLVLPWFAGGRWQGSFVAWSVPVAAALALWLWALRGRGRPVLAGRARTLRPAPGVARLTMPVPAARAVRLRPWPVIAASLLLGSGSLLFFGMDTWIPVYYHYLGRSDGPLALTVLTVAQLPPSLALTAWGNRVAGRRAGFIVAGGVGALAMALWFVVPAGWLIVLTALVGAASASIFILGLSLPGLLAGGADVARISGIMLGVSYTMAFAGPFLGGALWDHTGVAILCFLPILVGALLTVVFGSLLPRMGTAVAGQ